MGSPASTRLLPLLVVAVALARPIEASTPPARCTDLSDHPDVQAAWDAQDDGDLPRAVELGTRLVGRCPQSALAHQVLGNAYLWSEAHGPGAAVEELRRAQALDPDDLGILEDLAMALGELERPAELAEVIGRLVEADPKDRYSYSRWARAHEDAGDIDAAAGAWRLAIERGVGLPEAWSQLGDLLLRDDRPGEAAEAYRSFLRLEPESAVTWNDLGNALDGSDREAAIAAYRKALEHEAEEGRAYIYTNLSLSYAGLRRFEESVAAARQAVDLEPEESVYWYNLGIVLRDGGELPEAAEALRKATELEPRFEKARRMLAGVEERLGNRRAADADEAIAGGMTPRTLPEWEARVAFLRQEGMIELEGEARREVVDLRSKLETAKKLARSALGASHVADALAAIGAAEAIHPEDPELRELRRQAFELQLGSRVRITTLDPATVHRAATLRQAGLAAYEQGDHERAESLYRQSLDADPGSAATWHNLGLVCSDLERWDASVEAYRKALELEPEDSGTWNNLGYAYFYAEKYPEARAAYERAIALRDGFAMAWGNLAEVCQILDDRPCLEGAIDELYRLGKALPEGVEDPRSAPGGAP